jgi:hypothetical protein
VVSPPCTNDAPWWSTSVGHEGRRTGRPRACPARRDSRSGPATPPYKPVRRTANSIGFRVILVNASASSPPGQSRDQLPVRAPPQHGLRSSPRVQGPEVRRAVHDLKHGVFERPFEEFVVLRLNGRVVSSAIPRRGAWRGRDRSPTRCLRTVRLGGAPRRTTQSAADVPGTVPKEPGGGYNFSGHVTANANRPRC